MELATKQKIPFDNMPDIDQYLHDEKFWSLMDVMEKVAKKHGNYFCTLFQLLKIMHSLQRDSVGPQRHLNLHLSFSVIRHFLLNLRRTLPALTFYGRNALTFVLSVRLR